MKKKSNIWLVISLSLLVIAFIAKLLIVKYIAVNG
jgi:hypothetical protein